MNRIFSTDWAMDAVVNNKINRILEAEDLPALPAVAITALQMADDDKSSLQDIATLLQKEPALSSQLIKAANSALYGSITPVSAVEQALSRVGLSAATSLITTLSLKGLMHASKAPLNLEHFWRRSVLASGVSAWLAGFVGVKKEEALLAALVQDIGVLAASSVFPEHYDLPDTVWQDHQAFVEREVDAFGCDHLQFSTGLLHSWGFPEPIVEAVALSHELPTDGMNPLAWCVAGSNEIAHIIVRALESGSLVNELRASLAFHWLQHRNHNNIEDTIIECLHFSGD